MKKYWLILKNKLQVSFTYRANYFGSFVTEGLSLAIMVYLWLSIYNQGGQIGNYSLAGLISYFILTRFINLTVRSGDTAKDVGETIRLGEFNNYLVKPISLFANTLMMQLGSFLNNAIIFAIVFLPIVILSGMFDPGLAGILGFAVSFVLAFLVNFLIGYLIGISTFYFHFIAGFNFVMFSLNTFLSGGLVPVDLFPAYLRAINDLLPFKYITYVPISILTGKISSFEVLSNLSVAFLWVIVLGYLSNFVFKRGIKRYEAFSG